MLCECPLGTIIQGIWSPENFAKLHSNIRDLVLSGTTFKVLYLNLLAFVAV